MIISFKDQEINQDAHKFIQKTTLKKKKRKKHPANLCGCPSSPSSVLADMFNWQHHKTTQE
jgi:hypothetical protein